MKNIPMMLIVVLLAATALAQGPATAPATQPGANGIRGMLSGIPDNIAPKAGEKWNSIRVGMLSDWLNKESPVTVTFKLKFDPDFGYQNIEMVGLSSENDLLGVKKVSITIDAKISKTYAEKLVNTKKGDIVTITTQKGRLNWDPTNGMSAVLLISDGSLVSVGK